MTEHCENPLHELSAVMFEVEAIADILGAMAMSRTHTGEGTTAAALTWLNDKLSDADMRGSAALAELKGGKA